jgi:tight adherence protein C
MSLTSFMPGGLAPETLLALIAGAAAFLTLVALARAFVPHDPMTARSRQHAERRKQLRSALLSSPSRRSDRKSVGLLRGIVQKLKLAQSPESRSIAERLTQAGWRSRDALTIFLGLRAILPFIFAGFFWLALATVIAPKLSLTYQLGAALLGATLGAYAPNIHLKNAIQKRRHKIQRGLPDALDLLVICAEAGLSLDGALTRVARELGRAFPELSDEFGLTAIELGFLPNRTEALRNLQRRVDMPAMRGVVNTLAQTERYGTPLAQSLRVLAAEFRDQRMMKAEEKAGRLPATLTVPMILFILPTLFIVLIGPAMIRVYYTFMHH